MTASSIKENRADLFGPQFAIDNCFKDGEKHSFISTTEPFPWFQWLVAKDPNRPKRVLKLTEIIIGIPRKCCGYGTLNERTLERFEVRAGSQRIDHSYRGHIKVNQVCDSYKPENPNLVDGEYAKYVFRCNFHQDFIKAKWVTVQILGTSVLAISEIEVKKFDEKGTNRKRKFYTNTVSKNVIKLESITMFF